MKSAIGFITTILFFNIALASDVRLAGMGGGSIAVADLENDVFYNPANLVQLRSTYYIGGMSAGFHKSTYDISDSFAGYTTYREGYNPVLGGMLPLVKGKLYGAAMVGGAWGNYYGYPRNYGLMNLRLGYKLGFLGLGLGYDRIFDDYYDSDNMSIGWHIGNEKNNLNYLIMGEPSELFSKYYMELRYQTALWKWLGIGLKGSIKDRNYYLDPQYETGLGVDLGLKFIRTKIAADFILRWGYEAIWSFKQDSLVSWYYNLDEVIGKRFGLNGASGRIGIETQVKQYVTVRAGLSSWGPDVGMIPYSTVYKLKEVSYTAGATVGITEKVKLEYAYNGNFNEYFSSNSWDQRHYLKVIYKNK
ncbi:MAG: hypothetical protein KJ620_08895 [Candidatus Edwardsbacteria bacterium]|nr:hypothetical protein [Candidatus Edwardsbacteria bacterium]MBU1577733.1 hypothetical protein [Candidatus Edwardsbacteria bacterium]MBU2462917.1 hypothetical protein [Candidatus Edwardsbacteria bacterium]MBU2594317.1 hypothetical protein [Candidatus Edwardsbacteria bacterium]